jgi:hypothetical protein
MSPEVWAWFGLIYDRSKTLQKYALQPSGMSDQQIELACIYHSELVRKK